MMASKTTPAHRLNYADASPELREKLAQARARAIATRHLEGPPSNVIHFPAVIRATVLALRQSREAAGLSVADVATKCGVGEDDIAQLEAGAFLNPTWKLLGDYAHAVGAKLILAVEPNG